MQRGIIYGKKLLIQMNNDKLQHFSNLDNLVLF